MVRAAVDGRLGWRASPQRTSTTTGLSVSWADWLDLPTLSLGRLAERRVVSG